MGGGGLQRRTSALMRGVSDRGREASPGPTGASGTKRRSGQHKKSWTPERHSYSCGRSHSPPRTEASCMEPFGGREEDVLLYGRLPVPGRTTVSGDTRFHGLIPFGTPQREDVEEPSCESKRSSERPPPSRERLCRVLPSLPVTSPRVITHPN